MTRAERSDLRRSRQERRRRRQERRVRKPWIIFRRRLDRDLFENTAIAATGLDDFGKEYYGAGLDILLTSLRREAELTFLGSIMNQRAIVLALKQRLLLEDLRKRDPDFLKREILPPIIVTGLPRTGTTLVHRLLAEDPASRAPLLRELVTPIGPASRLTTFIDNTRFRIELATLRFQTSGLDAMHMSRIDEPEECMFAMSLSFRSMLFWTLAPAYSYMEWYKDALRAKKYRDYRDILRLLQARAPERRLVLKAPEHLGSLAALLRAVPEALVVVCHRHTPDAVTSFNSLIHALHQSVSTSPDPRKVAEINLGCFEAETRRYVEARAAWGDRILEIDYDRLVADPLSVAAAIYDRAGLALTPDLARKFQAFIAANPKDKYGRHRYTPSDFGQTEGMIAERLAHYRMAR